MAVWMLTAKSPGVGVRGLQTDCSTSVTHLIEKNSEHWIGRRRSHYEKEGCVLPEVLPPQGFFRATHPTERR